MKYTLKFLPVLFCLFFQFNLISQIKIVNEKQTHIDDNELCLGKRRYTGWVASYHQNGKLKSCYEVKKGKIEGRMIEFWIFKADLVRLFNDTIDINNLLPILEPEIYTSYRQFSSTRPIKRKECLQVNFIKNGIGIVYDYNGIKFGDGQYKDNKQNGLWTYYHEKGKILAKGEFVNGNEDETEIKYFSRFELENGIQKMEIPTNGRTNLWSFYYINGNLKKEANYKEGKLNGISKYFYEDGKSKIEMNYSNDQITGDYKVFYNNGNIKFDQNYTNGKVSGLSKEYFEDGKLKIESNYDANEKKTGVYKEYYNNGSIKFDQNYYNGMLSGLSKEYFEDGKPKIESNYINGKKEGIYKEFYNNGNIKFDQNYTNGKLSGLSKEYFENGKIKIESNYLNDSLNGSYKEYFESGKIKIESNYLDGKLNGLEKEYYENGKVQYENNYRLDKLTGISKKYYLNGNLNMQVTYVNGKAHGLVKLNYESGKLHMSGNKDTTSLSEDQFLGDIYEYNENGTLKHHIFIDINGNKIDKTPKKEIVISATEMSKPYKCKCCKATINGLKNGVDNNGDQLNDFTFNYLFSLYSSTYKVFGYQNVYEMFRAKDYKYCTMKCARLCYE